MLHELIIHSLSILDLGDHQVVVVCVQVLLGDLDDRIDQKVAAALGPEDVRGLLLAFVVVLVESAAVLEQVVELTEAIVHQLLLAFGYLGVLDLVVLDGLSLQFLDHLLQVLPEGVILEPGLAFDDLHPADELVVVLLGLSIDPSAELRDCADSLQLSLSLLPVFVLDECVLRAAVPLDGFLVVPEHLVDLRIVELHLKGLCMHQLLSWVALFLAGVDLVE